MSDSDISSFVDITGSSAAAARNILEMTNGDLTQAIQLFFENPDLQYTAPSTAAPAAASPAPHSTQQQGTRGDGNVITISDDEEDFNSDNGLSVVADGIPALARTAQEEEDAMMAQRLQEELFSGNPAGGEDVRSPIRSTTETLVPGWGGGSNVPDVPGIPLDDDPELLAEFRRRRRRAQQVRAPNPFNQSIWDDPEQRPSIPGTEPTTRAQRLTDLFRPPYELISRFSWEEARDEGKDTKKWILVNIQDMSDFNCQALNRDIWSDIMVRELVKENFVFLQYPKDDVLAQDYLNFYFRNHDAQQNYPHVAIVDPRTGEQVKVWSGTPFPSASDFHGQLVEFLDRYSLNANSKNPVIKAKPPRRAQAVDVDRMTEEEMLQMAMQNSLDANGAGTGAGRPSEIVDPDSLTKSPLPKSGETPASPSLVDLEEEESSGPFGGISSANPHVEPENDPATTTRIQFRHASGRIIRRFHTQDTVRRLYEWLKAEPMEGKEGAEFELKRMPQGQDLIEILDQTIEEAGLKQGTVMIEFL